MHELVLPYLSYVQTKFSDPFINVRISFGRNFIWVWNFTTALYCEHCDKDLVREGAWHVHHVLIAEREDEEFVKERVFDIFIGFGIHATTCKFNLN